MSSTNKRRRVSWSFPNGTRFEGMSLDGEAQDLDLVGELDNESTIFKGRWTGDVLQGRGTFLGHICDKTKNDKLVELQRYDGQFKYMVGHGYGEWRSLEPMKNMKATVGKAVLEDGDPCGFAEYQFPPGHEIVRRPNQWHLEVSGKSVATAVRYTSQVRRPLLFLCAVLS